MVKLDQKVKDLINKEHLIYAATASTDGVPNVSPKGSIAVVGDDTLAFAEIASPHTIDNLKYNPKIALYVLDKEGNKGCQIKGTVDLQDSGPLFEKLSSMLKEMRPELPPANFAVVIKVEDTFPYNL
ncbi:pyridoxamine 5-phosphate oxidase [archaeon]|nr:MAG: pyridoxamine 5-phosphate oxidase [archaeon]